jgi:CRP/FNR family cyclic AMP-dependent transcriptional regulator
VVSTPRSSRKRYDAGRLPWSALMDAIKLLRSIPLFEGLADEDVGALALTLERRTFKAGTMIFAQGDSGSSLYIVDSGDVNIHLPGEASRRISLKDIARGEYFGELALFDEKPRSASALATTDAVLFELQRTTLAQYLERRPAAAMAILRTLSERLRETNTMLSARAARNVDEEFDKNLSWSDRLADGVAALNGSWKFILFLIVLTAAWCVANTPWIVRREVIDPYPFQLFNLALAILVGLQGPLIVMSQNRQSLKDRARADTDFKVNLKNEVNIETLLRELSEFRAEAKERSDRARARGELAD